MSQVQKKSTALIMAGGTGGHIFPGIAVAKILNEKNWQVNWLGSQNGMEEKIVSQHAIELSLISISGLRGNGVMGWFKAPFSLTKAIFQAIKIIHQIKPTVIIGFGGFVSGPGGVAAFLTRTSLIIHEQNAVAGLTNKLLAKLSKQVFQAFPSAFENLNQVETVGNPIRQEIKMINAKPIKSVKQNAVINILIIGGSRGALALNKYLPKALAQLINNNQIKVRHQVGKNRLQETEKFYFENNIQQTDSYVLDEFIDDMSAAFEWADLLICRAGASTVSEVAAAGVCAIFVPFPYAVDDHQTANANWLVEKNAAVCVSEQQLVEGVFSSQVKELIMTPDKINQMAFNAKNVAYLNAAEKMVDYCEMLKVKAA